MRIKNGIMVIEKVTNLEDMIRTVSKAATEIVADSFKKSFLEKENVILSTARAGNVIGEEIGLNLD